MCQKKMKIFWKSCTSEHKAQITVSISDVVIWVATVSWWRSAVSSFSAARVSVFRLHSAWHWVLWKVPRAVRTWPCTGSSLVNIFHVDNLLMRWPVCFICVFALAPGLCVPIRKHWPFSRLTLTFSPLADLALSSVCLPVCTIFTFSWIE